MEEDVIRGQQRGREEVNARQIAMYLIRSMTNLSLEDIGKQFDNRDHTTVLIPWIRWRRRCVRPGLCRGGQGDHHQHQFQ